MEVGEEEEVVVLVVGGGLTFRGHQPVGEAMAGG